MNWFKRNIIFYRFKWELFQWKRTMNWIITDIKKSILPIKEEEKKLKKAYKKGKDIQLGKSWGWDWEGDHFHKQDGTVVRRTDYIKK